jgi:hypothetical protein
MRIVRLLLVVTFCLVISNPLLSAPFKPGNILVSNSPFGDEDLMEFTPAGTLVQSINISPANNGLDLIVDRDGRAQLYNGVFNPTLTQYDPKTNSFSSRTFAGWSTVNNLTYGGVATNGRYVFATDMNTNGGEASGVVRFDLDGGATTRFATNIEPLDLNMGLDGLLYTLSRGNAFNGGGTQVDVYNPTTMAFIRTVTLPEEHRAIAVAANGHIFTAQRDTVSRVNHYDPNGVRLDFIDDPGVGGFADIDLNDAGGLLIASHGGVLLLTDTNLDSIRFFQTRSSNGTNFATWVPEPTLMAPLLALAFLATRTRPMRK